MVRFFLKRREIFCSKTKKLLTPKKLSWIIHILYIALFIIYIWTKQRGVWSPICCLALIFMPNNLFDIHKKELYFICPAPIWNRSKFKLNFIRVWLDLVDIYRFQFAKGICNGPLLMMQKLKDKDFISFLHCLIICSWATIQFTLNHFFSRLKKMAKKHTHVFFQPWKN